MNQRKAIEAALAEMGITNETQLNDAIRNMKPLNLSLMADRQQERKGRRSKPLPDRTGKRRRRSRIRIRRTAGSR